ncbi:MAG: LacI family DNA-binding transcriptional regulator [Clostridia bacterium]|nr:LacI family DNA-binding transcriptional regulator [Clostridia bacterium]
MGKTLLEISKEIGVSTATISRVLTGEDCVSPETRDRVLQAVRESGYEKRPRRRSAELRGSGTVLVIAGQLHNPIILGFIDGIRQRLAKEGMRTVISLSDYDTSAECDALKYASKNGFSGIFLLNAIESKKLVSLIPDIKTPMIFVNRFLHTVDTDVVTVDNYRCGYLATEYLIGRGHKRIAHIAGPSTSVTCRDRTQGYIDAMHEHGFTVDRSCVYYGDRRYKSGCEFGAQIAAMEPEKRFTAVFSTTGLMAAGMVDTLRSYGFRVPDDISVICNDDYSRDYMPCPIDFTTFEQDPILMGTTAAELLLERITNPDGAPKRMVFPPVLIEHNSVILKR